MTGARGRNEIIADLSYKPPKSMKKLALVDEEVITAGFEWGALNSDPDTELWAVRIPAGFKPADLARLKVKLPAGNTGDITGTLKRGTASFALRSVGGKDAFGGEEMQNLHCLVPKRSDTGSLYTVPKPIKHLILTPQDPTPTLLAVPVPPQPSRRPQPTERLKHAFTPIGAAPLSPAPSMTMEIDQRAGACAETKSAKKKHKKLSTNMKITMPDSAMKEKGKAKGKGEDKAANDPQSTRAVMDVDAAEVLQTKKPRKNSNSTNMEVESAVLEANTKKGKRKRKAESEA